MRSWIGRSEWELQHQIRKRFGSWSCTYLRTHTRALRLHKDDFLDGHHKQVESRRCQFPSVSRNRFLEFELALELQGISRWRWYNGGDFAHWGNFLYIPH